MKAEPEGRAIGGLEVATVVGEEADRSCSPMFERVEVPAPAGQESDIA